MRIALVWARALAERAEALDLELVAQHPVVHRPSRLFLEPDVHRHRQVVDPPAAEAADVIVAAGVAVEPRRMASGVDLADEALLRQPLEVAVDGAEADAG